MTTIDHNEYRSKSEIEIPLDNAAPTVVIDSPKTGDVLRTDIIPIIGTINDPNFDNYVLEHLGPDDAWIEISRSSVPIVSGKLGDWNAVQLIAGRYQIRVIAVALVFRKNQASGQHGHVVQEKGTIVSGSHKMGPRDIIRNSEAPHHASM